MAVAILLAWVGGLAMLARREVFVGHAQRLAEAALRLAPGATYFSVEQSGERIGFASTTIDTTATGVDVVDYFVADLPVAGTKQRGSARSVVKLSRVLALRSFEVAVDAPGNRLLAGGRMDGDSSVVYALSTDGRAPADSQRLSVRGPVLLPQVVPLAATLAETPKVGRKVTLPSLDPGTMQQRPVTYVFRAESLFTVVDSASLDREKGEWVSALTDTVRAWRLEPEQPGSSFTGWVDAQGRVVEASQPGGIVLKRMAYEMAFENWRIARQRETVASADASDIIERSAIAANVPAGRARLTLLKVRLRGVDLRGYALDGGRQRLRGDTLTVTVERDSTLTPNWQLTNTLNWRFRDRFRADLSPEPLLQVRDERIVSKAIQIVKGGDRNQRVLAEKLVRWVHDSLKKEVVFTVPNALEVLETRRGDGNEHTQLYVAFARALRIPARIATGVVYLRGKFYYHAWPEVYLGDWVAVDPTFGQFPADAGHLRFQVGGLFRQAELLRLIGNLKIDVLEAR
ncbi:MAG: transglutaminase domain-containing protein [Gemmatimonadaceae bacterium]|nr:transglutaminase domain-containing protein [Gemmatimonadaceae bacterium]